MSRSQAESLDLYYKHRYQLMNPLCRIITGNPALRDLFEHPPATPDDATVMDTVREVLVDNGLYRNKKARALLGDYADVRAAFTGDASEQLDALVRSLRNEAGQQDFTAPDDLHDRLLLDIYRDLYDTLLESWTDLENLKKALAERPQPMFPHHPQYLVRGDSQGMLDYLGRTVAGLPGDATEAMAHPIDARWTTNQPFSTSSGTQLATLAGRSLIWLIRIDPQTTHGRTGGLYGAEDEVLLPYDVTLAIQGLIVVGSSADVARVDLSPLAHDDEIRARMSAVYNADGNKLRGRKTCFVIAEEA